MGFVSNLHALNARLTEIFRRLEKLEGHVHRIEVGMARQAVLLEKIPQAIENMILKSKAKP